jgi:MFS family permease
MSSPFDDITAPSDQPYQKPRYKVERERAMRLALLLVVGVPPAMGISAAIASLIEVGPEQDCPWRLVGGVLGGIIGAGIGLAAAFYRVAKTTMMREVVGFTNYPEGTGEFRIGAVGGALLGGSIGAMLTTERDDGQTPTYLIVALLGGLTYLVVYFVILWRNNRRKQMVPLAEPVD